MKEFVEKLIARLEECEERYDDVSFAQLSEFGITLDYKYAEGKRDGVAETIEIINELAEEYNNGWILCSDRLPDFLDNVLVCTKSGGRTIAHLKHTPIEWRDMHMNKIDDVIAWKYLDAPYQPTGE